MLIWVSLLIVAGALSVPLVHEAGHTLAAVLVGGRRLRLERAGWLHFTTSADLPAGAWRSRLFYGAGPLANGCASVALWLLSDLVVTKSALLVAALAVSLTHLAFALVNLLPLEGYDGGALVRTRRASTEPSAALGQPEPKEQ